MEFLGVGAMEALLVLVVALIVVGPHRFPEIARQGGRWYAIARRYATEVSKDVRGAVEELQSEIEEEGEDLRAIRDLGQEMDADLRAIRDLGQEMDADLRASKLDVEEVGADTARAADRAGGAASSNGPSAQPPAAAPAEAAGESGATPGAPDATSRATSNDDEPAR